MTIKTGDGASQPVDGLAAIARMMGDDAGHEDAGEDAGNADAEDESAPEQEAQASDESSEDEDESEPTVIKHDGKEVKLTKSELIEMAQKGFDYSQKTMSLADERKALEPIRTQAQQARDQHMKALEEAQTRLQGYAKWIEQQIGPAPEISLAQSDAGYYLALKNAHESQKGKLQQVMAELRATQEKANQERQSSLLAKAKETGDYLIETLPGWKDAPEKSLDDAVKYIGKYGLTHETAGNAFTERGLWMLADKARQFDALMAEKSKLKPTAQLAKVQKPASANPTNQQPRRQEMLKAHRANPTLASLAALNQ